MPDRWPQPSGVDNGVVWGQVGIIHTLSPAGVGKSCDHSRLTRIRLKFKVGTASAVLKGRQRCYRRTAASPDRGARALSNGSC